MKILSINKQHNINYFMLKDQEDSLVAEELFTDREPRSRLIADIIKRIEEIINNRQGKIEHSAYVKYNDIKQIEGEYCLLRKGDDIYSPLISNFKKKDCNLDMIINWMISIAEIAREAEKKGIEWKGITLQSLWIDQDGNLKFIDPDIIELIARYRSMPALSPAEIYQPAEFFRNKDWDEKGRIYSVGIIFYYLVTGKKPFVSEDKSDLVDEIMNHRPLEPVYLNYKLSQQLNQFLMKVLNKEREQRIGDWDQFISRLKEIKDRNLVYASSKEQEQHAAKAEKKLKSSNRRKGFRAFWRKRGKVILIALAVVAVFIGLNFFASSDPYITEETSPEQVVEYFYRAINEKNVTLLDETNNLDLKRLDNMVMETHVITSMRTIYSPATDKKEAEEQQIFGITDMTIKEVPDTDLPTYRANYRFFYHETRENDSNEDIKVIKHEVQMEDILKLDHEKRKWQIVRISGDLEYIIEGRVAELMNLRKSK